MATHDSGGEMSPQRAREVLASLRLRPSDRVLMVGHGLTPAARLARYFVGPCVDGRPAEVLVTG
jgi:hypothetical protein